MVVRAFENWTDSAQGTALQWQTTHFGSTALSTSMTLSPNGDLGIGTTLPAGPLEISRFSGDYNVLFTAYAGEANLLARKARGGNPAAPTATLIGDELGSYAMAGYGTTGFSDGNAGMGGYAAENFTDSAQGAGLFFVTTPVGTAAADFPMALTPSGQLGIGPFAFDGNGLPLVADRLQVIGDIRVGTSGTNGCLKDFSGSPVAGTCASDLRFKKDVTPFASVLDRLVALQPVHYFWRADEFPDRHFGAGETAGLIAQDVEKALPELVETDKDGFKAVNYSKLPLFTIQAVKELKAQNDALRAEVDPLKQRVADLETLKARVAELEKRLAELVAPGRR
jgi:hypothetical protein